MSVLQGHRSRTKDPYAKIVDIFQESSKQKFSTLQQIRSQPQKHSKKDKLAYLSTNLNSALSPAAGKPIGNFVMKKKTN